MRQLVVDSFAGGGGASTGIEMALASLRARGLLPDHASDHVDFAINHDDAALAMHLANHPATVHLPHNVWKVSLRDLLNDDVIGLLWASPDCRHHSNAKGGAPVSKSVRDLAFVVLKWLKELRPEQMPRLIFIENVPEFRFWGPTLPDGEGGERPDPERRGETFDAWVSELRRMGYPNVEWRELRACEYGAPTLRKRLYLVASRDRRAIAWPEPTHGEPGSDAVLSGRLLPWPVSGDLIDWSLECPSIFLTRAGARRRARTSGKRLVRPLAPNTMTRIAKGVQRYVLDNPAPYLVTCSSPGSEFRGRVPDLATPPSASAVFIAQHNNDPRRRGGVNPGQPADRPMATVVGSGSHQGVIAAHMISLKGSDRRAGDCAVPHAAVCAGGQHSGVVSLPLARIDEGAGLTPKQLRMARRVARFLRSHGCWDGGDIVRVGDRVVLDVGMRMLIPRELARAQGFPEDYILAAPHGDGTLTDTEQRHKIGNSVCPQVAAALVAANYRPGLPLKSARPRPAPLLDALSRKAA